MNCNIWYILSIINIIICNPVRNIKLSTKANNNKHAIFNW